MDPITMRGMVKSLSFIFKPVKWAWKKIFNLEKIDQLQERIAILEKEYLELKSKITIKDNPLPADAVFIPKFGIWFSKSSGLHYCTSCRQNGLCTPLYEQSNGWLCKVKSCEQWYRKPSSGYNEVTSFDLEGPAY